jgi:predicted MFS family arabinose efflux permease
MSAQETATGNSRRYEITLLVLLVLFWGSVGLNRVGIGFIFPKIVPEFHMAQWQVGLLVSGTSVTWAIASLVGGWLSDRYGRRRVLLPAVAFVAATTAAMGVAWNFLSMFIVRDLLGLGDGVGWSVGEAVVNEESAEHRRGFNQALFTAGYTLIGAGFGAVIVTALTLALGWRWVFPIVGAGTLVVLLALVLVMREPPVRKAHQRRNWHDSFKLLGDPSMLLVTIAGCAILTWLQITIAFNHQFLVAERKFSLADAGAIAEVWGFAGAAGQVILSLLSDRLGRKPVVIGAALAGAVAYALYIGGGHDVLAMQLLLGTAGFCGFGLLPVALATSVSELVTDEQRAAALGMTNFFGVIIGTTVMPVVGGIVADRFGLSGALWIAVIALGIIAMAMIAVRETAPRVLARRGVAAGVRVA